MSYRRPGKKRVALILAGLAEMYPDAHCELDFKTPFQLLIATILSAQATDRQVNKLTPALFSDCPTPDVMSALTEEELTGYIRGLGLFRNKSRHILATCKVLVEEYQGEVPSERDLLEALPGVGRKTANVVLSNAFGVPALAVDTHVHRVANRLALANSDNPLQVEQQLMEVVPETDWTITHHRLIWHGRRVCVARRPRCEQCGVLEWCNYGQRLK